MSRIARQTGASDSAQEIAQPQNDAGAGAHPKIARRPAQWKRPIQEIDVDAPPGAKPTSAHASSSHSKAWQDDPNFGIALIAVILILNIILMAVADSPEVEKPEPSLMIQQVTRESVLPTQRTSEDNSVRMFANPRETSERTTRHTIYDSIGAERFTEDEPTPTEGFESGHESQ
jgi:hypothetical protein